MEQMKHLKELGADTNKAGMKLISVYPSCDYDEGELCEYIPVDCRFHAKKYNERGKTFTLQNILELLPNFILKDELRYDLLSYMHNGMVYKLDMNSISYDDILEDYLHIESEGSGLLNMAYRMLCWCTKNGYLKNKEE